MRKKQTPNNIQDKVLQARELVTSGKIQEALNEYEELLKLDEKNATIYADIGTVFAMVKRFDSAIPHLRKALDLGSNDAATFSALGTALYEIGSLEESIELFNKAISIDPNYVFAHYNKASTLIAKGDKPGAKLALEKCLTYAEINGDFWNKVQERLRALA